MRVTIDFKNKPSDLDIYEYLALYLIVNQLDDFKKVEDFPSQKTAALLDSLTKKMYIRYFQGEIVIRNKASDLFDSQPVEEWINLYRDKFKGQRSLKSKGDKQKCIKYMKEFRAQYPEYSSSDIIAAAERYVNECKQLGLPVSQADYFIYKYIIEDGSKVRVSDLLSTLEDIDNSEEVKESTNYVRIE